MKSLFKSTLILLVSSMVVFVPTSHDIANHPSSIGQLIIDTETLPKHAEKPYKPQALLASVFIDSAPKPAPAPPEQPKTGTHEDWMRQAGIPESDWSYVDFIMTRESGWCPTKWQGQHVCPDSYAPTKNLHDGWVGYGLCQSTPGIKMSSIGGDYLNDPVQQLKWCAQHANSSHGGWAGSYNYWQSHGNW